MDITYFNVVLLFQVITFLSSNVEGQDAQCPGDLPNTSLMTSIGNTCFQFVDQEEYWTGARDYCWEHGGKLITIRDEATNTFITKTLDDFDTWSNNGVWIGLHDRGDELEWKWVTDDKDVSEPLSLWTNWGSGHPEGWFHSNRDCVRIVRNEEWKWHETLCTVLNWKYRFICQYDIAEPEVMPEVAGQHLLKTLYDKSTTVHTETSETNLDSGLIYDDADDGPAPAVGHLLGSDVRNNDVNRSQILIPMAVLCATTCFIIAIVLIIIKRRRKRNAEEKDNIKNSAAVENEYSKICTGDTAVKDDNMAGNRGSNIYVDIPYPKLVSSKTENEIKNLKTDPFQLSNRPLPNPMETKASSVKVPRTLEIPKRAESLSDILKPSPEGANSVTNVCYVMPNPKTPNENNPNDSCGEYANCVNDKQTGGYTNEVNSNQRDSQSGSEYMPMTGSDAGSTRSSVEDIRYRDHIYSHIDNEYESLDEIKRVNRC